MMVSCLLIGYNVMIINISMGIYPRPQVLLVVRRSPGKI